MFGKDIELGFLVYALTYIEDTGLVKRIGNAVVRFAEANASESIEFENKKKLNDIKSLTRQLNSDSEFEFRRAKLAISNLYYDTAPGQINALKSNAVNSGCEDFKSFLDSKFIDLRVGKEEFLADYVKEIYNITTSSDIMSIITSMGNIDEDRPVKRVIKIDTAAAYIENYIVSILVSKVLNWQEMQTFLNHLLYAIPPLILQDKIYNVKYWHLCRLSKMLPTAQRFQESTDESMSVESRQKAYDTKIGNICADYIKASQSLKNDLKEKCADVNKESQSNIYDAKMFFEFVPLLAMVSGFCLANNKPDILYMAGTAVFLANSFKANEALSVIYSPDHMYPCKYCAIVALLVLVREAVHNFKPLSYSFNEKVLIFVAPICMLSCSYLCARDLASNAEEIIGEHNKEHKKNKAKLLRVLNKDKIETIAEVRQQEKELNKVKGKYWGSFTSILKGSLCVDKTEYHDNMQMVVYTEAQSSINVGNSNSIGGVAF